VRRVVRELIDKHQQWPDMKIGRRLVPLLREVMEGFAEGIFEDMLLASRHRNAQTVTVDDLLLVLRLRKKESLRPGWNGGRKDWDDCCSE